MLALYKILILDAENYNLKLKKILKLIYSLSYMDICAGSSNNCNELYSLYKDIIDIFNQYCFPLQQFISNDDNLQRAIEEELGIVPSEDPISPLLELNWNRKEDILFSRSIKLNMDACSKREILASIASQYVVYRTCKTMEEYS